MTEERGGRARGGAKARREARLQTSQNHTKAPAYIKRAIPAFNPYSEEILERIEQQADWILDKVGIKFTEDEEVLAIWKDAGARVEGDLVKFPPGMLREIIQRSAPAQFTQHARNPEKSVVIGGNNMVLVPAYGPPFVRDLEKGRRYATIEDFRNFVKLAYMAPGMHHSGGTVCEPVDLPVNQRHLDMLLAHIECSDKPFMGSVTAPERAEDTVKMAQILFGEQFVEQNCVLLSLINANSPLSFDGTMLGALKVYARANQGVVVSPFILVGAMSPCTPAAAVAQILAEAMSVIALTQLLRPGAPVVFGTFAAAMSMQSGAPTFGTPEPGLILFACAELSRRLGVPFRSGGGLNGSKIPDAQAAYEAANTLQQAAFAGVNFMLHTAGWLEGGLVMSYEKFIMDCDQASMLARFFDGLTVNDNGLGTSAFLENEPGTHFLGTQHTQENFKDALYASALADNNSFEQWLSEGELDMAQRAAAQVKHQLEHYQAPPLDQAIVEHLHAYVAQRKSALSDG